MKKTFLILFAWVVLSPVLAQQSALHGSVALFNSLFETGKRQYVSNAQVEEDFGKSQPTTTAADGSFRLPLIGVKDLEKVYFSVKKADFEVVNIDALQAVAGQAEPQRVYMAPSGKIAENKLRYYKINREAAEKALTEKLHSLEKEIQAAQGDKVRLAQLQEEYSTLQAQFDRTVEIAREWAERYSRTNLDDASNDFQQAFRYYQEGALEEALKVLETANIVQQTQTFLKAQAQQSQVASEYNQRSAKVNIVKKQTMEALRFKAGLHQTRYEIDKAESCYLLLMALDSSDMENLLPYAEFLQFQNQADKAVHYLNKCISLARNKAEKIELYLRLGLVFHLSTQWEASDTVFSAVEKIFEGLTSKDSSMYVGHIGIAGTITAFRFYNSQPPEKAMKILEKSIALLEAAQTEFDVDMAISYSKIIMGMYYTGLNNFEEAEKTLLEANDKIAQLARQYPDQEEDYAFYSAICQSELGDLYYAQDRMDEAGKSFAVAEQKIMELVGLNTEKYEYASLGILESLGDYHLANHRPEDAAVYYRKSIEVCDRIEKYNPKQFGLFKAMTLQNLGDFYFGKNDIAQALAAFQEALSLYEGYSNDGQAKILATIASLHRSMGKCLAAMQNWEEAKTMFAIASNSYQQLIGLGWVEYESDWAGTLRLQGGLFYQMYQMDSAGTYLKKSVEVYEKAAEAGNQQQYAIFLGETLLQLGIVHQFQADWKSAETNLIKALEALQMAPLRDSLQKTHYEAYARYMLASTYAVMQDWVKAKAAWQNSMAIYIELEKTFPDNYGPTLAANLGFLANAHKNLGETAIARDRYNDALKLFEKHYPSKQLMVGSNFSILLMDMADLDVASDSIAKGIAAYLRAGLILKNLFFQGGNNAPNWQYFSRACNSLSTQVDTLFNRRQYQLAERTQGQIISLTAGLRSLADSIVFREVWLLGIQSYLSLFVKKFKQSEKSARQALELDTSQTWIKTNLAHALLFQNQKEAAWELYKSLKSTPDEFGSSYKKACLKDLEDLEAAGIKHPDVPAVRRFLEE